MSKHLDQRSKNVWSLASGESGLALSVAAAGQLAARAGRPARRAGWAGASPRRSGDADSYGDAAGPRWATSADHQGIVRHGGQQGEPESSRRAEGELREVRSNTVELAVKYVR